MKKILFSTGIIAMAFLFSCNKSVPGYTEKDYSFDASLPVVVPALRMRQSRFVLTGGGRSMTVTIGARASICGPLEWCFGGIYVW